MTLCNEEEGYMAINGVTKHVAAGVAAIEREEERNESNNAVIEVYY
jgi:hypothetical protein